MKKAYNFKIDKQLLILENANNVNERFLIEIEKLQFDTKLFYETLFADVNESIEIEIKMDNSIQDSLDLEIKKIACYVYDTIELIVGQACARLNEECFGKVDPC